MNLTALASLVTALPPSVTLRARYRAREYVALPGFLGGTVHGALGHALASVGATADTFEAPPVASEAPPYVRANPPPRLIVAPPPIGPAAELEPGLTMNLGVVLIAPTPRHIGLLVAALEALGPRGLGAGKGRLDLIELEDGSQQPLWDRGRVIASPEPDRTHSAWLPDTYELRTTSPLQLRANGELNTAPTAVDLGVAFARRAASLAWTYGAGWGGDLRDVQAHFFQTLRDHPCGEWRVVRGRRWSSRQRKHHPVEGVLGRIPLSAGFVEAFELVTSTRRFGIGKGPGLGLGRFELARVR
ncbi:MAG: hypothetical protein KF901_32140 [Myxococcales bacterium]|nr:hypothetical protein [Myxococcales bacterium]